MVCAFISPMTSQRVKSGLAGAKVHKITNAEIPSSGIGALQCKSCESVTKYVSLRRTAL
jgi:hypothetical protein